MGEGLNKPPFPQRCLQKFFIFLSRAPHSFSRFALALLRSLHLRVCVQANFLYIRPTTVLESKTFFGFLCYSVTSIQSNRNELWEIRFWNFRSKIAIGFSQRISGRLTCLRWSGTAYNGEESFLSLVNFPPFETPRAFFPNKTFCLENELRDLCVLLFKILSWNIF